MKYLDFCQFKPRVHIQISALAEEFQGKTKGMKKRDITVTVLEAAVFESMQRVYQKYIYEDASLEVNLEWKQKNAMKDIFERNDDVIVPLSDSLSLMEAAVEDISLLMNDSGIRFRAERVFKEVSRKSLVIARGK